MSDIPMQPMGGSGTVVPCEPIWQRFTFCCLEEAPPAFQEAVLLTPVWPFVFHALYPSREQCRNKLRNGGQG